MTRAFQQLQGAKRFEIVPGASPAFDDERSFRLATELTAAWMRKHIGRIATEVSRPTGQAYDQIISPALLHSMNDPS